MQYLGRWSKNKRGNILSWRHISRGWKRRISMNNVWNSTHLSRNFVCLREPHWTGIHREPEREDDQRPSWSRKKMTMMAEELYDLYGNFIRKLSLSFLQILKFFIYNYSGQTQRKTHVGRWFASQIVTWGCGFVRTRYIKHALFSLLKKFKSIESEMGQKVFTKAIVDENTHFRINFNTVVTVTWQDE